ncbi:hypothetical protein B0H17DRAFT_479932 [Mycena rosella]|uniref:F-box domain-containing protein n=1 Tax=Mycena rosella TaxID=1033263 RepID=A0AAD7GKV4_MYCRO|nr:hypothetical protein B0H17DRAFT_479932 [Mycena rosella]
MSAAALRARLADIDGEITQQKRVLHDLKETRASVQSQLDRDVYPVLTLPPEITSEIFIQCLPTGNAKVLLSQAPFLLLRICRQWREIALSTPGLWTTLNLNAVKLRDRVSRQFPERWVNLAAGWLRRAGSHPVSVTLRHPPEEEPTHVMYQPDLAFLRQISHQLESLEVHGLEQEPEENAYFLQQLDFTPGSFPLLRRLIFGPGESGTALDECWFAFFSDALQLRELALLGEAVTASIPLPWHQLTKFTGCEFLLNECVEVLRLAPDLEECTFSIQSPTGSPPPQSVIHPHLKTLSILPDSDGDCWSDILAFLTLPNVEALQFAGMSDLDTSSLEAFLSRSSASLRTFSVSPDRWADFSHWEQCFRLMPDLERLHLTCQDVDFQMDFMRTFGTSEEQLLPRLQHLNLFRPSARVNEMSAAVTQRKELDPDGHLSSVNFMWPVEGRSLRGMNIAQIL